MKGGIGLGIWIRSQNKKMLIQAYRLSIDPGNHFTDEYSKCTPVFRISENACTCLGEYTTKERALQVLDEIQGAIWESVRAVTFPNDGYVAPIYQMPAE
jgi:hypothetical protein